MNVPNDSSLNSNGNAGSNGAGSVPEKLDGGTLETGDLVKFDNKRTLWRVRAKTKCGRYALATCKIGERVYYTIIDFKEQERGAMNIMGGGLGIFSTDGPDEHIDTAIAMLETSLDGAAEYYRQHPENIGKVTYVGEWGVSSRNRVPLEITEIRPKP